MRFVLFRTRHKSAPIHFVKYFVVKFFAFSVLTRDLVHNFLINFLGRSYHQFLSKSTDCIFSGQVLFKKWANPGLFCRFIFCFFKQTSLQFLQQIHVKKCPSSIRCQDSNPQPLEQESPPIATRPGQLKCSMFRRPARSPHLWMSHETTSQRFNNFLNSCCCFWQPIGAPEKFY